MMPTWQTSCYSYIISKVQTTHETSSYIAQYTVKANGGKPYNNQYGYFVENLTMKPRHISSKSKSLLEMKVCWQHHPSGGEQTQVITQI